MSSRRLAPEPLESRIAPALLPGAPAAYLEAHFGEPNLVQAGQVLTVAGQDSGAYLLFVQKGACLAYFTDLNANGAVDVNELTGIAAGDGLQLISFVDIHGDVVTNLQKTGTASYSLSGAEGDGRVLLNSTIEKLELRSLRAGDLPSSQNLGAHLAPTTNSIYGNVYAGRGFGTADGKNGLVIDTNGPGDYGFTYTPSIGTIATGTAASGGHFSFGGDGTQLAGDLLPFTRGAGEAGGDINGLRVAGGFLNLHGLHAGNGGAGAKGGSVQNIALPGDAQGGYEIIAGDGGAGPAGGAGGSILKFSDRGSYGHSFLLQTGKGGAGTVTMGGKGGDFLATEVTVTGALSVQLGDGGSGVSTGGAGGNFLGGTVQGMGNPLTSPIGKIVSTTHVPDGRDYQATRIGTQEAVDFNGDGYGDMVYTLPQTGEVVVAFGDPIGGFSLFDPVTGVFVVDSSGTLVPNRVVLGDLLSPGALVVADLNADGHVDVAVASNDPGAQGGITVFLSQFTAGGSFTGFSSPRTSPLPLLGSDQFVGSPQQISSLVAGDFDGDGNVELAALMTAYQARIMDSEGQIVGYMLPAQVLLYLQPVPTTGSPAPSGVFRADFGTPLNPKTPFVALASEFGEGAAGSVQIEASPLVAVADGRDVVFAGTLGAKEIFVFDYATRSADGQPVPPALLGAFSGGFVDVDRALGSGHIVPVEFAQNAFSVTDLNGDNLADIAAISYDSFLVGIIGNGLGSGTTTSNGADNSGIYYGPAAGLQGTGGFGLVESGSLLGVKALDLDGDGVANDIFVVHSNYDGPLVVTRTVFTGGPQGASTPQVVLSRPMQENSEPVDRVAFDAASIYPFPFNGPARPLLGINGAYTPGFVAAPSGDVLPDHSLTVDLHAGDGGQASSGRGGAGGSITAFGLETELFPVDYNVVGSAAVTLHGGNGGAGPRGGAAGGAITKATLHFSEREISLIGGNGGAALINGAGGAGGRLFDVKSLVEDPTFFMPDYHATSLQAGRGGDGAGQTGKGGAGGEASNLQVLTFGDFTIQAGQGGNGTSGAAGVGGAILRSRADTNGENSSGTVRAGDAGLFGAKAAAGGAINGYGTGKTDGPGFFARAGLTIEAGDGAQGGAGGLLSRFVYWSVGGNILLHAGDGSVSASAAGAGGAISAISGNVSQEEGTTTAILAGKGGGNGTRAAAGGSISLLKLAGGSLPGNPGGVLTIAAGDAGNANGLPLGATLRTGANGGSVSNVEVIDLSPLTVFRSVAAGDGGAGKTKGGKGGDVLRVTAANHDIGVRTGEEYGYETMGGIFAGVGGATATGRGLSGSVSYISADSIASIVAGRATAPVLAEAVHHITIRPGGTTPETARFLGAIADLTADDPSRFRYQDSNGNGVYDLGETPVDGLVAARKFSFATTSIVPQALYALFTDTAGKPLNYKPVPPGTGLADLRA